jgi:hypothetical protein
MSTFSSTFSLARHAVVLGVAVATGAMLLGGCVPSRTYVLQPTPAGITHSGYAVRAADSAVKVTAEDRADFEARLNKKLVAQLGEPASPQGDLVIAYRFTLFEKGGGAARVGSTIANVVGSPFYGIGDGAVGVEVVYSKPDGTRLGQIVTDGSISGAFGSTGGALDEAATSIAKYTKANFVCPVCGEMGKKAPSETRVSGLRSE